MPQNTFSAWYVNSCVKLVGEKDNGQPNSHTIWLSFTFHQQSKVLNYSMSWSLLLLSGNLQHSKVVLCKGDFVVFQLPCTLHSALADNNHKFSNIIRRKCKCFMTIPTAIPLSNHKCKQKGIRKHTAKKDVDHE